MAKACPGNAGEIAANGTTNHGGRAQQLRRLRKGLHPTTGARLPTAIPEHIWSATGSFDDPEEDNVDADIKVLASSHVGRMRLKLRAREARADGSPHQVERAVRIESLLASEHAGHMLAVPPLPTMSQAILHLLATPMPVPPTCVQGEQRPEQCPSGLQDAGLSIPALPTLSSATLHLLLNPLPIPAIYPPGYSGDQPSEWDVADQRELDEWISAGRPEVSVDGVPTPGCINHPWVTYSGLGDKPTTTHSTID